MVKNTDMTPKQRQYIEYIEAFTDKFGFAPTVHEIAVSFLVHDNGAWEMLGRLKKNGYIDYDKKLARTIRVLA